MSNRGKAFKITWGDAFANTLNCGYPLDSANAYSESRDGSIDTQYLSGVEDAWLTGVDQYLTGDVRWIPRVDITTPEGNAYTGWEGSTGWRAFLEWARAKNVFNFYPDPVGAPTTFQPCYLVEPSKGPSGLEADFTRKLSPFTIRTSDGSVFTGY
jgi:hypothetical protein